MQYKAWGVYELLDLGLKDYKEMLVVLVQTEEDANIWITDRKRVQCYAQDKYEVRPVAILNGTIVTRRK
jgi:hypothetical protein